MGVLSPPHCRVSFPSVSSLSLFSFRFSLRVFKKYLSGFMDFHSFTVLQWITAVTLFDTQSVRTVAAGLPPTHGPNGECLLATPAPPTPLRGFTPTSFLVPFRREGDLRPRPRRNQWPQVSLSLGHSITLARIWSAE